MAANLNIVIVEDNHSLRLVTVNILRQHGHKVIGLACAEDLEDVAAGALPDIFILDLNLPGEDGISLAHRIRKANPSVGIIMVTARIGSQDKTLGYETGADIYLPKPVEPGELLAAINALARRIKTGNTNAPISLTLDLTRLQLQGPEGEASVSQKESTLLNALARAPGQQLEYWQIAEAIGEAPDSLIKSNLEVKIFRLRKKIAHVGFDDAIRAIRSKGYQLCINLIVR